MVSVVVPTRNRPRWLAEAIGCALAQSRRPAEIVVVEDGEGAGEEVAALEAARRGMEPEIRLVAGPRRGPAAARNVGVAAARAELIAFLDDDDLWHPEKLARQVEWFVRRPDLGALGTGWVGAQEPAAECFLRLGRAETPRAISHAALLRSNRLALSSVVVRRQCLEQCGGFDETLPLAQDWDLWLRMSERWWMGALPEALTVYRRHPEQRTRDQGAMRQWEAEVMRRAMQRDGESSAGRGIARRRLAWAHCRLGRLLLRQGEAESARPELRLALSLAPLHPVVWGSLARCAWVGRAPARQARP